MTDEIAEVVQPDPGQGDAGEQSAAPYADFVSRFPEEVRGTAEEAFKAFDANVTRRFQEAAEYRKGWEPYEPLGIRDMSPEDVAWTMQLRQAALENPAALREWLDQTHGPYAAPEPAAPQPAPDEFGYVDPAQQQLESLLKSQLGPLQQQIEQMNQWREQQEQHAREQQIAQVIGSEIEALKEKHAASLPESIRQNFDDTIERFAERYAAPGADPKMVVAKAWADFEALVNQLQVSAFQSAADAPAPAESGGVPDLSPEKISTLKEAEAMARQQLRANRAA